VTDRQTIVTRGHFESQRWRPHIVSAITENPILLHANRWLNFSRTGLMGDRSLHGRNRNVRPFCFCDLDLDLVTFKYELDPYSLEIHRMYKYELRKSRLSKLIAWQKSYARYLSLPVTRQIWRSHHSIRRSHKPHGTFKPYGSIFSRSRLVGDRSLWE